MQPEDLKTFGAVEMTLGLLDVSLASLLYQVETFFKKEIFVVFLTGVWTFLTGFSLVCGGRKSSYECVRFNVTFHQATVILSAVAFGTMVRHVPYQQRRYCKTHSCGHVSHDTMVLVGGILAILVTVFLVQTVISLAVVLIGLVSMWFNHPQSQDPEHIGSTTSEPLCLPPQNHETPWNDHIRTDGQ